VKEVHAPGPRECSSRFSARPKLPPPVIELIAISPGATRSRSSPLPVPGSRDNRRLLHLAPAPPSRCPGQNLTRQKPCPSIGKSLGTQTPCLGLDPVWKVDHRFRNQQFEIDGILTFDTTNLHGQTLKRFDFGGQIALFLLSERIVAFLSTR